MALDLKQTDNEGILIGKKTDGKKYTVRADRRRYFFPDEWKKFIYSIKNKQHRFFFITSIHTGGRIMEILNLRHKDIDVNRGVLTFTITKHRVAKKTQIGKSRGFFVSSNFIKEYKSLIRNQKTNPDDYIFLDNEKLPDDYSNLNNVDRKKYYISKSVSYSRMLKEKLRRVGVEDYYNFSPHNIRKTYGMWMRIFIKNMSELCYRMGNDEKTFMSNYGSSLIFSDAERREIEKIFGVVK